MVFKATCELVMCWNGERDQGSSEYTGYPYLVSFQKIHNTDWKGLDNLWRCFPTSAILCSMNDPLSLQRSVFWMILGEKGPCSSCM